MSFFSGFFSQNSGGTSNNNEANSAGPAAAAAGFAAPADDDDGLSNSEDDDDDYDNTDNESLDMMMTGSGVFNPITTTANNNSNSTSSKQPPPPSPQYYPPSNNNRTAAAGGGGASFNRGTISGSSSSSSNNNNVSVLPSFLSSSAPGGMPIRSASSITSATQMIPPKGSSTLSPAAVLTRQQQPSKIPSSSTTTSVSNRNATSTAASASGRIIEKRDNNSGSSSSATTTTTTTGGGNITSTAAGAGGVDLQSLNSTSTSAFHCSRKYAGAISLACPIRGAGYVYAIEKFKQDLANDLRSSFQRIITNLVDPTTSASPFQDFFGSGAAAAPPATAPGTGTSASSSFDGNINSGSGGGGPAPGQMIGGGGVSDAGYTGTTARGLSQATDRRLLETIVVFPPRPVGNDHQPMKTTTQVLHLINSAIASLRELDRSAGVILKDYIFPPRNAAHAAATTTTASSSPFSSSEEAAAAASSIPTTTSNFACAILFGWYPSPSLNACLNVESIDAEALLNIALYSGQITQTALLEYKNAILAIKQTTAATAATYATNATATATTKTTTRKRRADKIANSYYFAGAAAAAAASSAVPSSAAAAWSIKDQKMDLVLPTVVMGMGARLEVIMLVYRFVILLVNRAFMDFGDQSGGLISAASAARAKWRRGGEESGDISSNSSSSGNSNGVAGSSSSHTSATSSSSFLNQFTNDTTAVSAAADRQQQQQQRLQQSYNSNDSSETDMIESVTQHRVLTAELDDMMALTDNMIIAISLLRNIVKPLLINWPEIQYNPRRPAELVIETADMFEHILVGLSVLVKFRIFQVKNDILLISQRQQQQQQQQRRRGIGNIMRGGGINDCGATDIEADSEYDDDDDEDENHNGSSSRASTFSATATASTTTAGHRPLTLSGLPIKRWATFRLAVATAFLKALAIFDTTVIPHSFFPQSIRSGSDSASLPPLERSLFEQIKSATLCSRELGSGSSVFCSDSNCPTEEDGNVSSFVYMFPKRIRGAMRRLIIINIIQMMVFECMELQSKLAAPPSSSSSTAPAAATAGTTVPPPPPSKSFEFKEFGQSIVKKALAIQRVSRIALRSLQDIRRIADLEQYHETPRYANTTDINNIAAGDHAFDLGTYIEKILNDCLSEYSFYCCGSNGGGSSSASTSGLGGGAKSSGDGGGHGDATRKKKAAQSSTTTTNNATTATTTTTTTAATNVGISNEQQQQPTTNTVNNVTTDSTVTVGIGTGVTGQEVREMIDGMLRLPDMFGDDVLKFSDYMLTYMSTATQKYVHEFPTNRTGGDDAGGPTSSSSSSRSIPPLFDDGGNYFLSSLNRIYISNGTWL